MSKKIVKPISSNIAYHPSAQIFSLLTQEKEIQLAKQIEHHYKKILWVAAQCPNALDVLHTHFQKIIQGKVKLNSFVSGLVFEEHFANTQRPACNLKTLQSKMTSLSVLQSLLKEQIQVFGRDHKTALATQKSLAEYLNTFKWTSTMIERLVQAIQSLADDSGIPQIKRLKLNLRLAFESFNAAKKELFEGSLRLVFSIAQKYHFKGLDYRVLIQQGAIGLNKAIERFQYRLDCSFSTYAACLIRYSIVNFISKQKLEITLPGHQEDKAVATNIDSVSAQHLSEMTHQALSHLSEKEAAILKRRFGIEMDSADTVEQIIEQFNISCDDFRRLEAKALKTLTQGRCKHSKT
jgi:RNA polymerase sigma factor (sigma-70 family)